MGRLLEARDTYTYGHSRRVARHAQTIARGMRLPEEQVEQIRQAALLHDIGKIYTPREIIDKPGKLTDEEFAVIRAHPVDGAGPEVLDHDVGAADQLGQQLLAALRLGVEGDAPLVAVEHREVERVGVRHVAQLAARRVALRVLELDHVRAHPGEQLTAGGSRLDMGHVQDADAFECAESCFWAFHFRMRFFACFERVQIAMPYILGTEDQSRRSAAVEVVYHCSTLFSLLSEASTVEP